MACAERKIGPPYLHLLWASCCHHLCSTAPLLLGAISTSPWHQVPSWQDRWVRLMQDLELVQVASLAVFLTLCACLASCSRPSSSKMNLTCFISRSLGLNSWNCLENKFRTLVDVVGAAAATRHSSVIKDAKDSTLNMQLEPCLSPCRFFCTVLAHATCRKQPSSNIPSLVCPLERNHCWNFPH